MKELTSHNYEINLFLSSTNVPPYCDRNAIIRETKSHLEKYGLTSLVSSSFHLFKLFLQRQARIFYSTACLLKCRLPHSMWWSMTADCTGLHWLPMLAVVNCVYYCHLTYLQKSFKSSWQPQFGKALKLAAMCSRIVQEWLSIYAVDCLMSSVFS